uniref:Uncharacterized protein n=1 Tax=Eptatretus burgeri TaxID=7764 RepID=A0A8C4QHU5_EPTBU
MEQPEGCPPVGSGSSQQPSSFSQVIFHNVGQSYLPDVNMECRYSITPQLQPHAKDWVGIFKVGWSSPRDYYTFLWASTPGPSEEIVMLQLVFQAYYLPKNDGEFYQFCYVTHMGEIRGASAPFQFRAPSPTDELFTLEMDECSGLLMVTTKTSHLEDCLKESNSKIEELVQCKAKLEEERRGLIQEVEDLRQNMKGSDTDKMNLAQELQREQNKVRALEQETKALQEKYGSSVARLRKLNEDHQALVQKVTQAEMEIDLLQKDVKKLTVEKQQLEKQKSNEKEEKELYMAQSKELDLQNSKLQHELDNLQSKLEKSDEELAVCKEEISGFNSTFSVLEQSPEVQEIENTSAKICEQLRQSEDQRAASEQRLQLLSEEILEATTTRDKTMADLHRSRLHCSKLEELLTHVGAQVQGFDVAKEGSENHAPLQKANEDLKLRLNDGCRTLQRKIQRLHKATKRGFQTQGKVERKREFCLARRKDPSA